MRNRVPQFTGLLLLCSVSLLCVGCTKGGGSGDVPVPQKLESDRVLGYVALPGLEKAIQDVVSVVKPFAPEEADPATLKAQIGSMLGDPQLEHLDLTKPIVVVAFRPDEPGPIPNPPIALYIPAKSSSPYAETLAQQGAQTKFTGGVLLAAQNPQDLELAEKNLSFYKGLAGKIPATGRLYLHMGRLFETFGPMIDARMGGLMEQMKASMSTGGLPNEGQADGIAAILAAELQGFLALARECEEIQADVDLSAAMVRFDTVIAAKPGSRLGGFFSASAGKPAVSTSSLEGKGLFKGAFHCDSVSLGALVKQLLAEMRKSPEVAKLLPAEATDPWTDLSWWSGDADMGMASVDGGVFTTDSTLGVQDPARYLELAEKSAELFEPGSALGDLYRGMGMGVSVGFQRDVRRHGDVPVHRFTMTLETSEEGGAFPPPNAELLKGMLRDYELAIVNGRGVMSQEPGRVDALIDAARAGTEKPLELAAVKAFGAGKHGYLDYDVIGLAQAMFEAMPALGEAAAAFENVTSKEPFVFAVTFAETRMLVQGGMPLTPFVEMVNQLKDP